MEREAKKYEDKLKLEKAQARALSDANVKLKCESTNLRKEVESVRKQMEAMKELCQDAEGNNNMVKSLQVQLIDRDDEIKHISR